MNTPAPVNHLQKFVLTLNVGSSSHKYAIFGLNGKPDAVFRGEVSRAETDGKSFNALLDKVVETTGKNGLVAVGHRIVHGGPKLSAPQLIDAELIAELKRLIPFAPEHLPAEIALIEHMAICFPQMPQIACFDTAFHRDMPRLSTLLPIPRRYETLGIRRYGFHGLSYEFLRDELRRLGDPAVTRGSVILAHLGNGASLAALKDGHCIDTSMAFTPAAGLVMATRSGDIDPGLIAYLATSEAMDAPRLTQFINHDCGLLGVSETTGDMRKLMELEASDIRAAEAVALFCYQIKKWIGAFTAALGGLDTLVFAGGIGEHNAGVRSRICTGLGFLGVELDDDRNASLKDAIPAAHAPAPVVSPVIAPLTSPLISPHLAPIISSAKSRVSVRVIHTDEELVIARHIHRLLKLQAAQT